MMKNWQQNITSVLMEYHAEQVLRQAKLSLLGAHQTFPYVKHNCKDKWRNHFLLSQLSQELSQHLFLTLCDLFPSPHIKTSVFQESNR